MFKLLGDRSAGERQVELARRDAQVVRARYDAGFSVFGFQKSVRRLRYDALNFAFRTPAPDGRVARRLSVASS